MDKPTKPGFYWYEGTDGDGNEYLWCVKVETDYRGLVGWQPYMDYADPLADDDAWQGEWLEKAKLPEDRDE